jgi:hypothetical protein
MNERRTAIVDDVDPDEPHPVAVRGLRLGEEERFFPAPAAP